MRALGNRNKFFKVRQEEIAEIRNALTIILGNAQILERDVNLIADQKKRLKEIGDQVWRITKLLD